ncbi:uncharacterized protein LOC134182018 isoform X2 [Corticium candelabrum]|nr:uncharacterized protein LOC134182018 isoform X2 [Corticium candelabrum]
MTTRDKLKMVAHAIDVLGVRDCQDTIFGNAFYSGLSGGEKKRANIACELLTDPAILMLDEPTSGLDSSTALSLLKTLRHLAIREDKTLIATIHQPSTQCYYEFDKLLLLCEGKVVYCGPTNTVIDYFTSIGFSCPAHYNPADYALELVTGDESQRNRLTESWTTRTTSFLAIPKQLEAIPNDDTPIHAFKNTQKKPYHNNESSERFMSKANGCVTNSHLLAEANSQQLQRQDSYSDAINAVFVAVDSGKSAYDVAETHKFPTSFRMQLNVLSQRSFRQAKPDILSKLGFIQNVLVALVASLIWFQVPREEKSIRDRTSFFFFHATYWGFQPVGQAALAFSQEKAVVMKERAAGSYRLSAYYLSKCFSEIPLIIVLPFMEFTIAYFIAGMHGPGQWILSFFILVVSCFAAQSLGLFVGALISNLKEALTASQIALLASMLVGGFYVLNLPAWIQWIQYLSFITYTFDAFLGLEFTDASPFRCDPVQSTFAVCKNVNSTSTITGNGFDYLISGGDILRDLNVTLTPWQCVLSIILYSLGFRILTYLALRYLHKPK